MNNWKQGELDGFETPPRKTSFTFPLTREQQAGLVTLLREGNYRPFPAEHTIHAAMTNDCRIYVYKSGKCLVQGKGASDFVTFVLEPAILMTAKLGYEEVHTPDAFEPHFGVDESGKGDLFGPLVAAAAYSDRELVAAMQKIGVKDSKQISSDARAIAIAADIRRLLGNRFSVVTIGPAAYNRLYAKFRNVNRMLAWAHARAIEDSLEKVPDCPRALCDQFSSKRDIQRSLMQKGRSIKLEERTKAESDMAVAAASILARAGFLAGLKKLEERFGMKIPKGASSAVREVAVEIARKHGPAALVEATKCHFKTTDEVLKIVGSNRAALGPDGAATSRPRTSFVRRHASAPVES